MKKTNQFDDLCMPSLQISSEYWRNSIHIKYDYLMALTIILVWINLKIWNWFLSAVDYIIDKKLGFEQSLLSYWSS